MQTSNNTDRYPLPQRKPYHSPEFSSFGDISQITRGGNGNGGDVAGTMTMACWIAEALYGVNAARTTLVRTWLTECYERKISWALLVMPLYRRVGRRVAAAVRSHRILQRLFRPLFDRAVVCAHRDYASAIARRTA